MTQKAAIECVPRKMWSGTQATHQLKEQKKILNHVLCVLKAPTVGA